jgi:cation diffusion facilitator family transporter
MFRKKVILSEAGKVAYITILINILLSIGKFLAGILGHSISMVADAVHSASDVLSTILVLIALRISSKKEDADHEYGHEKYESLASVFLALILGATGIGIGWEGISSILEKSDAERTIPELLPLVAAVISILVKEWMYHYTKRVGKKCHSDILIADAWHHRTDALSSVGSFVGIFFARIGFSIMDPIASLLICLFILKSAISIIRSASEKLTDHSCDKKTEEDIRKLILSVQGVQKIDLLKTRQFGSKFYIDVEIAVDESLSLTEAHEIAEKVHLVTENQVEGVKHCMVHVNPCKVQ